MKILLVDDHAVVRRGVRQILEEDDEALDIGEAGDAIAALESVRSQHWDLVLLDIRLPGRSGVEVLKQIKSEKPGLPVLILSSYPESQYAVRLIRAGAAGYLSKETLAETLVEAVRTVAKGRRYISPEVAELLASNLNRNLDDNDGARHDVLSNREYQIFLELASGIRPSDIADRLSVSIKTVATHRARILKKMGMENNAELTLYASRHQLLDN